MSVLTYNGVRMEIQKTERLGFGARYTEDGVDYLYTEFDIAVTAVVNPFALASQGPGQQAQPPAGARFQEDAPSVNPMGDSLGVSLTNLRQMLLTPRKPLSFTINGDTVVSTLGADARQGPQPQADTYVRWIIGTRTALVYFHVKCWVVEFVPGSTGPVLTTSPHIVLANRYRVTSIVDEDYWTRRHVVGQMIIDPSKLQLYALQGVLTPDNFRAAAFLQIPTGFKRDDIQVTVSSDNTTLDYSYVDQETPLALGPRSLVTRMEGYTTGGVTSPLATLSGASAMGAAAVSHVNATISTAFAGGLVGARIGSSIAGWKGGIVGGIAGAWGGGSIGTKFQGVDASANIAGVAFSGGQLPIITGVGVVRLWARRQATQQAMALFGINVLLDRFAGNNFNSYGAPSGTPRIGSIQVSYDVADRFVEVQISFIPTYQSMLNAINDMRGVALGLMNSSIAINSKQPDDASRNINYAGLPNPNGNTVYGPVWNTAQLTQNESGINAMPTSAVWDQNLPIVGGGKIQGPDGAFVGFDATRGDWGQNSELGAMVVALLGTPGVGPSLPTDPATNVSLSQMP